MIINKIQRWWQRRGFGIESKTDYAFLHDVLREQLPYYAYGEWQRQYPSATKGEHNLARLLFRISNHLQPGTVRIYGSTTELIRCAIHGGCRKAAVTTSDTRYFKLANNSIAAKAETGTIVEYTPHKCGTDVTMAIVMTDIDAGNAALWQQILDLPAITYDLRHTGIALIHKKRYPEHYKI